MNFKRILVGAGLIIWAILAFRFIPQLWISIPATYLVLWFCSATLAHFWSRTASWVFLSGWLLWWLAWWVFLPIIDAPEEFSLLGHFLGMTLTGVATLVTWKMGESWHAQDKPEDFNPKYLDALRRD